MRLYDQLLYIPTEEVTYFCFIDIKQTYNLVRESCSRVGSLVSKTKIYVKNSSDNNKSLAFISSK